VNPPGESSCGAAAESHELSFRPCSLNLMTESTPSGTRLAHIGIAVRKTDELSRLYRDILGLAEVPLADSDGARIKGFAAGQALIELLEPSTEDSPIGRFLAKRGPGIHHLCLAVEDLDRALQMCTDAGFTLIDQVPRIGAEGKRIAFLHPSSTGGILLELTEY
jgi:methylmalonyl-CoA/ethylmalonyl-CoA epimerase